MSFLLQTILNISDSCSRLLMMVTQTVTSLEEAEELVKDMNKISDISRIIRVTISSTTYRAVEYEDMVEDIYE